MKGVSAVKRSNVTPCHFSVTYQSHTCHTPLSSSALILIIGKTWTSSNEMRCHLPLKLNFISIIYVEKIEAKACVRYLFYCEKSREWKLHSMLPFQNLSAKFMSLSKCHSPVCSYPRYGVRIACQK